MTFRGLCRIEPKLRDLERDALAAHAPDGADWPARTAEPARARTAEPVGGDDGLSEAGEV